MAFIAASEISVMVEQRVAVAVSSQHRDVSRNTKRPEVISISLDGTGIGSECGSATKVVSAKGKYM